MQTGKLEQYWGGKDGTKNRELVRLVTRARFNPNMQQGWFVAINQIINNISVLAIFLTGAAVLREREHGTIEHLLVMPLRPYELMFSKIWANGLVVVLAAMTSLFLIVKGAIGVPVAGSVSLFAGGFGWYIFYLRLPRWGSCWPPWCVFLDAPSSGLLAFPEAYRHELVVGRPDAAGRAWPIALQKINAVRALDAFREASLRRCSSETRHRAWYGPTCSRCF